MVPVYPSSNHIQDREERALPGPLLLLAQVDPKSQTTPKASKGSTPPKVKSAAAATEAAKAKDAAAGKGPIKTGPPSAQRFAFWRDYYKTHDETAASVLDTVTWLRASKDMTDVEAVLGGFLSSRPERAEPWMFGTLTTAIEINGGDKERIKGWLDYCAQIAERDNNPNSLLLAADQYLLRGYVENVGRLLDKTAEKVPHRDEPFLLMLVLARKTNDADRMKLAGDKLLSLGWPRVDNRVRAEVHMRVLDLAKELEAKGKSDEAGKLKSWLPEAERRDLIVRATWSGHADLEMTVEDPLGGTSSRDQPRTVFGGALVKNGLGKDPEEIYVCPRGFDGDYKVRLSTLYNDPDRPIDKATVETIVHEGTPREKKQSFVVTLTRPEPVIVKLEGGRRQEVLPYTPLANAEQPARPNPNPAPAPAPAPMTKPATKPATGAPAKKAPPPPPVPVRPE